MTDERVYLHRWKLLSAAIRQLDDCATLFEVLDILRRRTRAIALADGVAVIIRDGADVVYVGEDAIAPLWTGQRFPIERCVSGLAILQREPILIERIADDHRVPHSAYLGTFVTSMAIFPVGGGNPTAALGCYWAEEQTFQAGAMALVDHLTRSSNAALERIAEMRDAADWSARARRSA